MKFLDANLLLLSYDPSAVLHRRARRWLENTLSETEPIGIPMLAIGGFLRISTDKRLPRLSLRMEDALAAVDDWISRKNVSIIHTTIANWKTTVECIQA